MEKNSDNCRQKPEHDLNPGNGLGLQERTLLMMLSGPQPRLEYPTEPMEMANGSVVERYVIQEAERREVLSRLYPFTDVPSMDEEMVDLHTSRRFLVREFAVVREGNGNFLVTPHYAEKGGTVLDWVAPQNFDDELFVKTPKGMQYTL